ncbi:MAG: hypothetical protein IPO19_14815 [Rhodoferax sp.]|nr:hypothetical protein [Rhodoferax sp.]
MGRPPPHGRTGPHLCQPGARCLAFVAARVGGDSAGLDPAAQPLTWNSTPYSSTQVLGHPANMNWQALLLDDSRATARNNRAHAAEDLRGDVQRELTSCPASPDSPPRTRTDQRLSLCHHLELKASVHWGGVLFADFYRQVIQACAFTFHPDTRFVVMRGRDGYRSLLPGYLKMIRPQPDVPLADQLNGPTPNGGTRRTVAAGCFAAVLTTSASST